MLKIDPRDAKTYWLRAMLQMEAMNPVDLRAKDIDAAIHALACDLPGAAGCEGICSVWPRRTTWGWSMTLARP